MSWRSRPIAIRPVRTFRSFSGDLHRPADWLHTVGITSVAMESTGVYWIPVFEIVEARGFEVLLVNARDVKQRSGCSSSTSTDSCEGVFGPARPSWPLRAYLPHRERLVEYAAAHIQHMQKALMQMNVQLHHAVTDITGATGMRIIRAIIAGTHAPRDTCDLP